MSHSVPKTLFTFPYLSPRPSSPNLLPALLKLGHGAQLHPPPHLAALCHCYRSVRTRPSQTALSSEANTNQPQMFTLGEKGQQMRSHSIKLASIPTLPLSLSLFFWLFLQVCKAPWGTLWICGCDNFGFIFLIPSSLSLCCESPGFPLVKKSKKHTKKLFSSFSNHWLLNINIWNLIIPKCKCYLQTVHQSVLYASLPSLWMNVSTPEFPLFDDKKRHNPGEEFQQQEQTRISPGNTRQTKCRQTHPWEIGR